MVAMMAEMAPAELHVMLLSSWQHGLQQPSKRKCADLEDEEVCWTAEDKEVGREADQHGSCSIRNELK
jgi:hypothetical protein